MSDRYRTEEIADRAEVIKRSVSRYRLAFVQFGRAFEPVRDSIVSLIGGHIFDLRLHPVGDLDKLDAKTVLVDSLEILSAPSAKSGTLGDLRAAVTRLLDRSQSVCLLSRIPRVAYPLVPGNSILDDAAFAFVRPFSDKVSASDVASRLPALDVESDGLVAGIVTQIFADLGIEILSEIEEAFFPTLDFQDDILGRLNNRQLEGLRGAGLIELTTDDRWSSVLDRMPRVVSEAVSQGISSQVDPPRDLGALAADLWTIERCIRHGIRRKLVQIHGEHWRKRGIPGPIAQIISQRAGRDSYQQDMPVSLISDPLEWLTINELLDMVMAKNLANLELPEAFWRALAHDIPPVRNRLSHMRLIRRADPDTAARWRRQVVKHLT